MLELRVIPANSRGEDFRSICGHWLRGADAIEVHEPYLHLSWQQESLAHLMDVARQLGVRRADAIAMAVHSNPGAEAPEEAAAGRPQSPRCSSAAPLSKVARLQSRSRVAFGPQSSSLLYTVYSLL